MELEIGAVATRLPDGRLALATWSGRRLRLWFCAANRCDRAPGETVLAEARDPSYPPGVALAARRDGGLVVAVAERELTREGTERTRDSGTASVGVDDLVSFIFCADAACSRPERRRPVRLDEVDYLSTMPLLTVALGPGDRPLAARLDLTTGRIQVISCADATCRESRVTTPVAAYAARNDVGLRRQAGLALAVRADGRPVIAYRDVRDRAAKLLDCRTPDCARADVITLDAGGPELGTPALVLDRTGRVLVAFHNGEGTRVMLAVCAGGRCTSTPVARIRGGADESLAMTLDGEGRPVIVWLDRLTGPEIDWELAVVTPLNLTR